MRNRKAQGISINIIVMIAIAVFVVFLILGFVTGGWSYFGGAFGGVTKSAGGYDTAKIKCEQWCMSFQNDDCPTSGTTYEMMYGTHLQNSDTNGDGEMNDCYSCLGDAECAGEAIDVVLTRCQCRAQ